MICLFRFPLPVIFFLTHFVTRYLDGQCLLSASRTGWKASRTDCLRKERSIDKENQLIDPSVALAPTTKAQKA
jgi:hypothetical protein